MDYKKEIKRLARGRERYFPAMTAIMDMKPSGAPVRIEDPVMMTTLLELIDIGYLDPDAFIIDKKFSEIRGVYYKGEPVLTETGWKQYQIHHNVQRKKQLRRLFVLLSLILLASVIMILVYMFK